MKTIIFGNRDFASLAHHFLAHETGGIWYDIVGFTVDQEFIDEPEFEGLPLLPFETVEQFWDPKEYQMFCPINYSADNPHRRMQIFNKVKAKGYSCPTYIHPTAHHSASWLDCGENCFILEGNTIQPYVKIGNNCVLWSGNHIGHHSEVKDNVMFASHVVLSGHCTVEEHSFLGVNATIRDGVTIGEGSLIGMGALVTKNTEQYGVYTGAPATVRKMLNVEKAGTDLEPKE